MAEGDSGDAAGQGLRKSEDVNTQSPYKALAVLQNPSEAFSRSAGGAWRAWHGRDSALFGPYLAPCTNLGGSPARAMQKSRQSSPWCCRVSRSKCGRLPWDPECVMQRGAEAAQPLKLTQELLAPTKLTAQNFTCSWPVALYRHGSTGILGSARMHNVLTSDSALTCRTAAYTKALPSRHKCLQIHSLRSWGSLISWGWLRAKLMSASLTTGNLHTHTEVIQHP